MKVNVVPTIIALAISALLAYVLYEICHTEGQEMLLAVVGGICLFLPLATCLGVRFELPRTSANVAVVGGVFFAIMMISNALFAFVHFTTPACIIVNGILLLLFLLIGYLIAKARQ